MFRGLLDFVNVMMMWGFAYVVAFILMIIVLSDLSQDPPQIIHQHTYTNVVEAKKTSSVCHRIDGCPIVDNVCIGCVIE